jgi:hypothetical protein
MYYTVSWTITVYLLLGDGKVLQATRWFQGFYDLEPLLPLLLERLLLRAHGRPLGGPHDNGHVRIAAPPGMLLHYVKQHNVNIK